MKNRIFELSTGLIARISCVWLKHILRDHSTTAKDIKDRPTRREPCISLAIIDIGTRGPLVIDSMAALRTLRDELDKAIYVADVMTVDQQAGESYARGLYDEEVTIKYALDNGMLRETKKEV